MAVPVPIRVRGARVRSDWIQDERKISGGLILERLSSLESALKRTVDLFWASCMEKGLHCYGLELRTSYKKNV